jgi:hypothetical protein
MYACMPAACRAVSKETNYSVKRDLLQNLDSGVQSSNADVVRVVELILEPPTWWHLCVCVCVYVCVCVCVCVCVGQ